MTRHAARWLMGVVLAVALAGCGVTPQRKPELLPPAAPPIMPPTVTQHVAPDPSGRPMMFPAAIRRAS